MKTLEQSLCEHEHCNPVQFRRKLFWRILYPHARLIAPFLGGSSASFFAADRELVAGAGRAADKQQLKAEIQHYFLDTLNRGWLRRRINLRASTGRLMRLADQYLADVARPVTTESKAKAA